MGYDEPEVVALQPCPADDLEVVWNPGEKEHECAMDVMCLAICNLTDRQHHDDDCKGVILPVIFNEDDSGAAPFEAVTVKYYDFDGPIVRRKKESKHV